MKGYWSRKTMGKQKRWGKQEQVSMGVLLLASVVGLLLRWQGIRYESGDFQSCLSLWMDNLKGGGISILSQYTGDYNMPYVTVLWILTYLPVEPIIGIKSFSILFDFICAAAGGALAVTCSKNEKSSRTFVITYCLIFLSPIAVMNSGYWGQCDSVYVAFVLLACWCMLKDKHVLCMIFWGCAFAFKLQAIFGFPILLLYYWKNRKFSFLYFLLIPVAMEVLCLPAILGGCSPLITFTVYLSQMKTFPEMYYFYPNLWTFFQDTTYYVFGKMAITGTLVILMLQAVWILSEEEKLGKKQFFTYFTWILMTVLCFLPCMHERYGYMLEMAAIIYAVIDRKKWWFALGLHIIMTLTYAPGILGHALVDARILAAGYLILYMLMSYCRINRRKQYA